MENKMVGITAAILSLLMVIGIVLAQTSSVTTFSGTGEIYIRNEVNFGLPHPSYDPVSPNKQSHMIDETYANSNGGAQGTVFVSSDGTNVYVSKTGPGPFDAAMVSDGIMWSNTYTDAYWLEVNSWSYVNASGSGNFGGLALSYWQNDVSGEVMQGAGTTGAYYNTEFSWDDKTDEDGTQIGIEGSPGLGGMGTYYWSGNNKHDGEPGVAFNNGRETWYMAIGPGDQYENDYAYTTQFDQESSASMDYGSHKYYSSLSNVRGSLDIVNSFSNNIWGWSGYCAASGICSFP
jgi:hypothetical protein